MAVTVSLGSQAPAAICVPGEKLPGVWAVGTALGYVIVGVFTASCGVGGGGCGILRGIGIWVHRRSWSEMWYGYCGKWEA